MNTPTAASPMSMPTGRHWHIRLSLLRAFMCFVPPCSLNLIRRVALKWCGLRTGPATLFLGMPKLRGAGNITARLNIGAHCGFNDGCEFDLAAPITIGNHVAVGHEVRFVTTVQGDHAENAAPITIEDGVWLGARCTIMPGVVVGAGTVIGAGVIVTADVPSNMLVTGAKPVSLAKWR